MALTIHPITSLCVADSVRDVLLKLKEQNAVSYIVGGAVRDLLCGRSVNDYDIVTTLDLQATTRLFPHAKTNFSARDGLAWKEGEVQFEITTFCHPCFKAANGSTFTEIDIELLVISDARGRDFTVNALYLDLESSAVIDPLLAFDDINKALIRCVTDAETNIRSNPLHMLRAIRFAHKLDFTIDVELQTVMRRHAGLIAEESPGRTLVELYRQIISGFAMKCLHEVCDQGLHMYTFPGLQSHLASKKLNLLQFFLESMDRGFINHMVCTRGFVFAVLIWEDVLALLQHEAKWTEAAISISLQTALARQAKPVKCKNMLWDQIYPIVIVQKHTEDRVASLDPSYTSALNFSLLRGTARSVGLVC